MKMPQYSHTSCGVHFRVLQPNWCHFVITMSSGTAVRVLTDRPTATLTTSQCAPPGCWLITYMKKKRHVHHLISTKQHCAPPKCFPCAPWCTSQVGGAQHRSVVHNIVLYCWSGAQHRSHKPGQTDKTILLPDCWEVNIVAIFRKAA